ncbi:neurotrophin receptor-interacting factor homolog [Toxorhynchites rutilus septentrionalis]|uniref:neurotrophin receptor-interacting factor homolog n=1 Tax=Toxorhynchites rutilus septentrionalis TaxID=329112 RepID=UPI0024785FC6|nr:neurotrophin receptor-interacting factor homolog [Toxorhynchites rutilus septentrionalis]XP_055621217.1 neurotrophin receptor-interacting factor homolog [Toxorhynchites rutilus septentrionalis]
MAPKITYDHKNHQTSAITINPPTSQEFISETATQPSEAFLALLDEIPIPDVSSINELPHYDEHLFDLLNDSALDANEHDSSHYLNSSLPPGYVPDSSDSCPDRENFDGTSLPSMHYDINANSMVPEVYPQGVQIASSPCTTIDLQQQRVEVNFGVHQTSLNRDSNGTTPSESDSYLKVIHSLGHPMENLPWQVNSTSASGLSPYMNPNQQTNWNVEQTSQLPVIGPDTIYRNCTERVAFTPNATIGIMPVADDNSSEIILPQNQQSQQEHGSFTPNMMYPSQQPVGIWIPNSQQTINSPTVKLQTNTELASFAPDIAFPSQEPIGKAWMPVSKNDADIQPSSASDTTEKISNSLDRDEKDLKLNMPPVVLRIAIELKADQWIIKSTGPPITETNPPLESTSTQYCLSNRNIPTDKIKVGNPNKNKSVKHQTTRPRKNVNNLPRAPVRVTNITKFPTRRKREIVIAHTIFCCEVCNKKCTSQAGLTQHRDSRHSDIPRPFRCESCGKRFITEAVLVDHQRSHSEKYKANACGWCDRRFVYSKDLDRHLENHTSLSFVCSVQDCGKGFARADHLRAHEQSHIIRKQLQVKKGRVKKRVEVCST